MQRKTRWIVCACLAFIVIMALPRQQALRYMYPLRYSDTLIKEADRHGLDPLLVAAVARVESHFNASVVSPRGAIGVMQVMPRTGAWVAERLRLSNWRNERLYDPHINIRVGTWYLSYLIDRFNGKVAPAVAAYNGGYTNVRKWIDKGVWDGTLRQSNNIPFPETRKYVTRVLRSYEWYRKAYPNVVASAENHNLIAWAQALASTASEGFHPLLSK